MVDCYNARCHGVNGHSVPKRHRDETLTKQSGVIVGGIV
jgi:hypothetical protein